MIFSFSQLALLCSGAPLPQNHFPFRGQAGPPRSLPCAQWAPEPGLRRGWGVSAALAAAARPLVCPRFPEAPGCGSRTAAGPWPCPLVRGHRLQAVQPGSTSSVIIVCIHSKRKSSCHPKQRSESRRDSHRWGGAPHQEPRYKSELAKVSF